MTQGQEHRRCSINICYMNELIPEKKKNVKRLQKYLRRKEFQEFVVFQIFVLLFISSAS